MALCCCSLCCSRPKAEQLSTREMIQRDRNMQRLGLHCVEELPKPGECERDGPGVATQTGLYSPM